MRSCRNCDDDEARAPGGSTQDSLSIRELLVENTKLIYVRSREELTNNNSQRTKLLEVANHYWFAAAPRSKMKLSWRLAISSTRGSSTTSWSPRLMRARDAVSTVTCAGESRRHGRAAGQRGSGAAGWRNFDSPHWNRSTIRTKFIEQMKSIIASEKLCER